MNIQTQIRPELWQAVARTYAAGNYKSAILDAFHYLTDVIREKGDVEGDGAKMIGPAFGGNTPRIRINKLQTQSERDAQAGLQKILEGIYQGIRNPRSHEQIEDTQATADAIILFINYVLGVIDTSKGPFVLEEWLERVFDPDFVRHERYAKVLVDKVPPKRHVDTWITLYRQKMKADAANLCFVFEELLQRIGDNHVDDITAVVSDELRAERSERVLKHILTALPCRLWSLVDEDARLRIENKLLRSVDDGVIIEQYIDDDLEVRMQTIKTGGFGTFALTILDYMEHQQELFTMLYAKTSRGHEDCAYVIEYFLEHLPHIADTVCMQDESTVQKIAEHLWNHYNSYSHDTRDKLTSFSAQAPQRWASAFRAADTTDLPF